VYKGGLWPPFSFAHVTSVISSATWSLFPHRWDDRAVGAKGWALNDSVSVVERAIAFAAFARAECHFGCCLRAISSSSLGEQFYADAARTRAQSGTTFVRRTSRTVRNNGGAFSQGAFRG
jgi:hypothetical protein